MRNSCKISREYDQLKIGEKINRNKIENGEMNFLLSEKDTLQFC